MRLQKINLLLGLTILLLATTASATTILRMDLPQLVNKADSIVQGRVDEVYVQWDAERKLAFTYISVNVGDPMKGERRRSVLIKQVGGKVGALSVNVAGMPKFAKGEEVLVFLKDQQDGTFMVLGMNQGKYEITADYAVSNVSGIEVVNPKTGRIESPAFVERLPLETLKSRIRELVK